MPQNRAQEPVYRKRFTFDAVYEIIWKTVLHPKGAWGLAAGAFMKDQLKFQWQFQFVLVYAIVVSVIQTLYVLNRWLISGNSWQLDPNSDVVVITGGRRGLGLLLAAEFSSKGFKVATIDIKPCEMQLGNTTHYIADVGQPEKLATVISLVRKSMGVPTVLINCAGTVSGGLVEQLSDTEIGRMMSVNFLGPVNLIRQCLTEMKRLNRGYIINIASSTAYLGPAKAGIYAASKAALMTFHESLRRELAATQIKTVLAIPGQLDSAMFASVKTPNEFIAPVLRGSDLAVKIMEYVEHGWCGQIQEPAYVKFVPLVISLVPTSIVDRLRNWSGMDHSMDTFRPSSSQEKGF